MESKLKRLLSLLMVVFMVVSMLPTTVFAATEDDAPTDYKSYYEGLGYNCITVSTPEEWAAAFKQAGTVNPSASAKTYVDVTAPIEIPDSICYYIGGGTSAPAQTVVINLNGNTLTQAYARRVFGIYNGSSLTVLNGTVQQSSTYNSNGLVFFMSGANSGLTLDEVTVSNNADVTTTYSGGLIYSGDASQKVEITNSTLNAKATMKSGSAIYSKGTVTLNSGTINGGPANYGGAVYLSGGNMTINGGTINGGPRYYDIDNSNSCRALCFYVISSGSVVMNGGTINNANDSTYAGSVVYISDAKSTFEMYGGTISDTAYKWLFRIPGSSTSNDSVKLYNGTVITTEATPEKMVYSEETDHFGALASCACVTETADNTYTVWQYKLNDEGTCADCGQTYTNACTGTHTYTYAQKDETNHTVGCSECDYTAEEAHALENGICKCGYVAKTYVAAIGDDKYESLDEALEAAEAAGMTEVEVQVLADIEWSDKIGNFSKVTFTGSDREQTVTLADKAINIDTQLVFNDLTVSRLSGGTNWLYHYFYVRGGLSFNNCKMIGLYVVTAQDTDFIGCDFYNDDTFGDGNYSLWLYNCYDGVEVNITDCTFDVYERAIKLYGDGYSQSAVLNISGTQFVSRTADKTVVEITYDNDSSAGSFALNVTDSTYTGFGLSEHLDDAYKNSLFNVEGTLVGATTVYKDAVQLWPVANYVAFNENTGKGYATVKDAVAEASDGDTIRLDSADTAISMNAVVDGGRTITFTGEALVDWTQGNLWIGREGNGGGKVIFDGATITSAEKKYTAGTGIHVSGAKAGSTSTCDGILEIKNSNIQLDYLVNRNEVIISDNSDLTVYGGTYVHGRAASESVSGTDEIATLTVKDSKLTIVNINGCGIGDESYGELILVNADVVCQTDFVVRSNGTVKMDLDSTLTAPSLSTNGKIVVDADGFTGDEVTVVTAATSGFTGTVEVINSNTATYEITDTGIIVKEKVVASVTDAEGNVTNYATLAEAFANAEKGDTITLLSDVTLTEQLMIKDNDLLSDVTLNGNGYTIYDAVSGASTICFGADGYWATGVKLVDVTVEAAEGNENPYCAIRLYGGTSSELTNVNVVGEYTYGVNFYGTHGATLTNCNIDSAWINGQSAYPLNLVNSTIGTAWANSGEGSAPKVFLDSTSSIETLYAYQHTEMIDPNSLQYIGTVLEMDTELSMVAKTSDGTLYSTLELALNAAESGETVELLSDVNEAGSYMITEGDDITVKGNGYTINCEDGFYVTGGKLTLCDDLTVKASVYNAVYLRGGEVITSANLYATGEYSAIQGNGSCTGDVTINGGDISSTNGIAIYWPQEGKLTINGGTITGGTAVYLKSGSLEITGGTLTGNGAKVSYEYSANGAIATGAAVVIENVGGNTGYEEITSVSITGGTFITENASRPVVSHAATAANPDAVAVKNFITGGVYNKRLATSVIHADMKAEENAETGMYEIVDKVYVVSVTDAEGNVTKYESISSAKNYVTDGSTVTLLADVSGQMLIDGSKNVTLELNGFAWTATYATILVEGGASLTVQDSSEAQTGKLVSGGDAITVDNGALTVKSGTIETTDAADTVISASYADITIEGGKLISAGDGVQLIYNSESAPNTFTMTGGEIDAEGYGITGNGTYDYSTVIVSGGIITGGIVGIYHPQGGTMTISGGTVSGGTGVYVKGGNVTISDDAVINGTGEKADPDVDVNTDGTTSTGDALVVHNEGETSAYGKITVSVTGGTFTSANAEAVAAYATGEESTITGFIPGDSTALFSSDVSAHCAAGYEATVQGEGGMYGVSLMEGVVAWNTVTGEVYKTVAEGLSAAKAGETVQLLDNATEEQYYIIVGADVTLDINGKTLTVNNYLMTVTATSYVIDSTNGDGVLKIAKEKLVISADYTEDGVASLPIWIEEDAGYRMTTVTYVTKLVDNGSGSVQLRFYPTMDTAELLASQLADGAQDNDLTVKIVVYYTNTAGARQNVSLYFLESTLVSYGANWPQFLWMNINGLEGLSDVVFEVVVACGDIELASEEIAYTPAEV